MISNEYLATTRKEKPLNKLIFKKHIGNFKFSNRRTKRRHKTIYSKKRKIENTDIKLYFHKNNSLKLFYSSPLLSGQITETSLKETLDRRSTYCGNKSVVKKND